jgi:predicted metal-dependent phosphoesterase TrpH
MDPLRLVKLAHERGLTHLAITDHDTIDGALAARDSADRGLQLIVGQEVRTKEGDIIALFIERPIPAGHGLEESVGLVRQQGGLVGLAHPFDVRRPSVGQGAGGPAELRRLAMLADYIEVHNGRVQDAATNARAADMARAYGLAGVAVSDAHVAAEVGTAATVLTGPIESADDLRRSLGADSALTVREPYQDGDGRSSRWLGRRRD